MKNPFGQNCLHGLASVFRWSTKSCTTASEHTVRLRAPSSPGAGPASTGAHVVPSFEDVAEDTVTSPPSDHSAPLSAKGQQNFQFPFLPPYLLELRGHTPKPITKTISGK